MKRALATVLIAPLAISHAFPILYLISLALKSPDQVFSYPPSLIPSQMAWANFADALRAAPLLKFMLNSFIAAAGITTFQVVTSTLAGFVLAQPNFRSARFLFPIFICTIMVPAEVTVVPNYLTVARLGWVDTYYGLIAPFAASGFGVFMLYQFFRSLPKELAEAAVVDGAGTWRFLWYIALPLARPAISGFAVFSFVSAWNQYLWPLVVTQTTGMRTVQIGIGMFRAANESNNWGMIMAATLLLVLPSLLLFVLTQKQLVRGMTMSGLK